MVYPIFEISGFTRNGQKSLVKEKMHSTDGWSKLYVDKYEASICGLDIAGMRSDI